MRENENVNLDMESLVNSRVVAELLGLSVRTIGDMAARRELPVYKIGRSNRFLVKEILDWRDKRKVTLL